MRPSVHEREISPSMGSISSPWDNAAAKSLMGLVKSWCVHARTHETRGEATLGLFEHTESVRNRARAHAALGD